MNILTENSAFWKKAVLASTLFLGSMMVVTTATSANATTTIKTTNSTENFEKNDQNENKQVKQLQKASPAVLQSADAVSKSLSANSGKLIDDPNATVITDDTIIPSEYSFFARVTPNKTTITHSNDKWEETFDHDHVTEHMPAIDVSNVKKGQTWLRYNHVNVFGKDVDMKWTIMDYTVSHTNQKGNSICFATFTLGNYLKQLRSVNYKIEFLKSGTDEPEPLSGFFTFNDVDWLQYVTVDKNMMDHVSGIYVDPKCILSGTKNADGSETFAEVNNEGVDVDDPKGMVTLTFKDISSFGMTYGHNSPDVDSSHNDGAVWFGTSGEKVARSDDPLPSKDVSDNNQKNVTANDLENMSEPFTYTIKQNISGQLAKFYHSSFELTDSVIPELEKKSNLKIVDETGKDSSSFFKDQSSGNKIDVVATPEALNKAEFYDHVYSFSFDVDVKDGMNLDKYLNKTDNTYHFPNKAQTVIDGKVKPTNDTDTKVKETPDDNPIKKIISNGKEVDSSKVKEGDNVEFVVSNPTGVPYSSAGKTFTLYDDLEDVLDLDEKNFKMEISDLNSDKWVDITSKGKVATDSNTEKLSWSIADAKVLAGKKYRLTLNGKMKKHVGYSDYVDDQGTIKVPNTAHQVIADKDKPTNTVTVTPPAVQTKAEKFIVQAGSKDNKLEGSTSSSKDNKLESSTSSSKDSKTKSSVSSSKNNETVISDYKD